MTTTNENVQGEPAAQPEVTIISPLHNESDNVDLLVAEIAKAGAELPSFEVVLVDDGSRDDTAAKVTALQAQHSWLRLVQHKTAGGQSAAVHSGVQAARGRIICTLDGDLQNPPSEIPKLCAPLLASDAPEDLGLVAGQRAERRDTLSKRLASRFANKLRAWILNDATRDTGCGLKAFRRNAFLEMPFFNHMHRYLPALFGRQGWRVAHVDVAHAERAGGQSKYTNIQRALVGVSDLLGVAWLIRRAKTARPVEVQPEGVRAAAKPDEAQK